MHLEHLVVSDWDYAFFESNCLCGKRLPMLERFFKWDHWPVRTDETYDFAFVTKSYQYHKKIDSSGAKLN